MGWNKGFEWGNWEWRDKKLAGRHRDKEEFKKTPKWIRLTEHAIQQQEYEKSKSPTEKVIMLCVKMELDEVSDAVCAACNASDWCNQK